MKIKLLSAAILAASLCVPAMADDSVLAGQSEMTQMLLKYDTNKDGIISRDEMLAAKTAEFTAADTNGDGFLSWAEFKAMEDAKRVARMKTIFAVMDADKNGSVSSAEFMSVASDKVATQAAVVFALGDTNSDGALSFDELSAMRAGSEATEKLMWAFAGLDTVADGQLSLAEFTAPFVKKAPLPPLKKPEMKGRGR